MALLLSEAVFAGTQLVELAHRAAQRAGIDALDTQAGLLGRGDRGPSWNKAPPPVTLKFTLWPTVRPVGFNAAENDNVDELNDTVLPEPVAATLFTVATMSCHRIGGGERTAERAAGPFVDDLHRDVRALP